MSIETLLMELGSEVIVDDDADLPPNIKGYYTNKNATNLILLNKHLMTSTEKACILAEEIGHYYTTVGNILDQSKIENRKQERRARAWAYEKLVPLDKLSKAYKTGFSNHYELAEILDVTEEFLEEALQYYKEKYNINYREEAEKTYAKMGI